jgi:hypothetical protein
VRARSHPLRGAERLDGRPDALGAGEGSVGAALRQHLPLSGRLLREIHEILLHRAGLPIPFATFAPNVLLDPTRTYLFLIDSPSPFNFTYFGTAPYAGGAAFQAFGPDVPSAIWLDIGPGDIAFSATFGPAPTSTVPEPATVATLGAGLLALSAVTARRHRLPYRAA